MLAACRGPKGLLAITLSGLFVLASSSSYGAMAEPLYTLEHIDRSNGLPQSSVRAIAVDQLGFLWIGTETGVVRYDGHRFKEITPPFGHGVVMSMNADSRGRLWIRWYGKPLTVYDPSLEHWQVLDGLDAIDTFGGFAEDASGTVWLASSSALRYFDEKTRHFVSAVALQPDADSTAVYFPQLAAHRGKVWVATDREIVSFDTAKRMALRMPAPAANTRRLWVHRNELWLCNSAGLFRLQANDAQWQSVYRTDKHQISACEFGADGALWLGTNKSGVIRVHEGLETRFQHRANDNASLVDNFIVNIQLDGRGELWVMTPGNAHRWLGATSTGKRAVDERPSADQWELFAYSPDSVPANPGGPAATSLTEDLSGVLWLGSENAGLAKISRFARKARHLLPPSRINPHVRTPAVDQDGNVWMGMNQDGVFRWNRAARTWTHFAADANNVRQLPSREVRAVFVARDGGVWAGSSSGGTISRFKAATADWQRVAIGANDEIVFNFLELADGRFIIGRQASVTEFDPITQQRQHYPSPHRSPLRASVLSRNGNVYFGTHQSGVVEFIPGRGFARSWLTELSDPNVFSIYEDRNGMLWIGTWGGGLNRLDPSSGKVQVIGSKEGLPDTTIFSIQPGKHDDLWVSTYAGLARIENCVVRGWPCQPQVSVYNRDNGIPISEFDSEAATRSASGELFFGGLDGLIYFDPDRLELNPRAPRMQVSALSLSGKPLRSLPMASANLATPSALELPNNFGSLLVEFSALDFHASTNNRYRYRLAPAGEWVSLGNNPSVVLNGLTPGLHTLELLGANNDGVWSKAPLILPIRVLAPWYRSVVALLVYAVLLALAFFAFVKWRERRLRASNVRLEATVAERTRELAAANLARDEFYANVSHEIRTPLTLLVGTAEALNNRPDPHQVKQLAGDLIRYGDSLRRYVESLITVAHLQSSATISWMQEDIAAYLRSLIADFQRIAGSISITLAVNVEKCFVRSYPNALDTIFSNLLVNAIRHTPIGGAITATVREQNGRIAVDIADSGSGIEPQLLTSLFERGPRGKQIAQATVGYGIGLNLVKQTIDALAGSIEARNNQDGGACFTVTLPRADASLPLASFSRTAVSIDANSQRETASIRKPEKSARQTRGSILIVEDHDELRTHLVALFATNYRVREAANVAEGLAQARKYLPDVVVCDVLLPDGQGFDVVAALKSNAITDHISVILLTALADEASRLRGLTEQADLYVTKPFRREELLLQVANLMNQRRRLRRAAAREAWAVNAASGSAKALPIKASFESRLLATLESLYGDADCDIDTIADKLAMSRKQLERKTRYCFKCTPKVLLNRYRLDKAVPLLESGAPVIQVAERCGFGSHSYFGALFKKRFGHAPSQTKSD